MAPGIDLAGADDPKPAAGEKPAPAATPDPVPAKAAAAGQAKGEEEARAVLAAFSNEFLKNLRATLQGRLFPAPRQDPEMLRQHFLAEFTQQFRPLLTAELRFIDMICRPTPEEQGAIRAAGDASLQLAVKTYVDALMEIESGGLRRERPKEWPNPRKLILEELARSVRQTLPGDRAGRYQQELEKRAAARKRATLVYVVSKLDRALLLSDEQREALMKVMNSNWKEAWGERLEHLRHGEDLLPVLPDDQVLPILSDAQRELWNRRSKVENGISYWGGFGFFQPPQEEALEAPPAGDEPKEKDQAAAKKPEEKR